MTCEECKWWKDGVCHRHSPKVIVVTSDNPYTDSGRLIASTEWPTVFRDDYCGEFETV